MNFEKLAPLMIPVPVHIRDSTLHQNQRNWVIRFVRPQSDDSFNLSQVESLLSSAAVDAVLKCRSEKGLIADNGLAPRVQISMIDNVHLLLQIEELLQNENETFLVAASAALRILDEMSPVDDIQGLPRQLWRLLIGPSASALR